jgi:protein SCO1/2
MTMRSRLPLLLAVLAWGLAAGVLPLQARADATNYFARGILKEVNGATRQIVITHEKIGNFMDAMTMPFNVKDAALLTNLPAAVGRPITFQLHVTETESWVDHVEPLAAPPAPGLSRTAPTESGSHPAAAVARTANPASRAHNPLRYYPFTNELGQAVSLADFHGQALALTFFYTRCPVPDFCPRLSRNFQETESALMAMKNAPTNWHLLSVTFDPAHDSPAALRSYAAAYQYDPSHWSFLTGPEDKIAELARLCGVDFRADDGTINHNFRTLIIDASNRLQMVFPTSGNLSDPIVKELLKAVAPTNSSHKMP